jgi:hypothetical protein
MNEPSGLVATAMTNSRDVAARQGRKADVGLRGLRVHAATLTTDGLWCLA